MFYRKFSNNLLNITKNSKYLEKPSKYPLIFWFKNEPILNRLGKKKIENFCSSKSRGRRFRHLDVTGVRHFGKLRPFELVVIWNYWSTFFSWDIAELGCFWDKTEYCLRKIREENTGLSQKAMKISKYP